MQFFKNPFAVNENNEMVYIKEDDRDNKELYRNCYCPKCREKLIPRMGEKNRWHFAHKSNKQCDGNFESSLHLYAKELIKKNTTILLPRVSISEYISYNKMDEEFLKDLNKWGKYNEEWIPSLTFLEENKYHYKWIDNEVRIDDFFPDCVVEVGGKKLAVEIFVTHEVDFDKEKKVRESQIDMIEICLDEIKEDMQEKDFDLDNYILFDSPRRWIYKTRVESEEKKLYNLIYNTKEYIPNEKYTKKELYENGLIRQRKREFEERKRELEEQQKEKKREYAEKHQEMYRKIKNQKLLKVMDSYSKKYRNDSISVYNIPVKGEYVFDCPRETWQKAIFRMFILNREGKTIQLAKIISWVEKYSGLKYFKEFDYSKDEVWDSKYDAVKNYLLELKKSGAVYPFSDDISQWSEIRVRNGTVEYLNAIIKKNFKSVLVCNECGEVFDDNDMVNCCYLTNFGMDRECFLGKSSIILKIYRGDNYVI